MNITPFGEHFYYTTFWDKVWNLEGCSFLKYTLPLRNYGMDFLFSGNNENFKCTLHLIHGIIDSSIFGFTLLAKTHLWNDTKPHIKCFYLSWIHILLKTRSASHRPAKSLDLGWDYHLFHCFASSPTFIPWAWDFASEWCSSFTFMAELDAHSPGHLFRGWVEVW